MSAVDRGRFITFEGGEGTGKSTQIRLLAQRLESCGQRVVITREPGGSPGAEIIRHVLLSGGARPFGTETEAVLFAAARADHVRHLIAPALDAGAWVLCDRFADSTRVYQGVLGDVDPAFLGALAAATLGGLNPDLTLVLDVPVVVALARASARRGDDAPDRFEQETEGFHQRLRQAFLDLARSEPERCVTIDADARVEVVAERVFTVVASRLGVTDPSEAVTS